MVASIFEKLISGSRSTRYSRIRRFREMGVLEDVDGKLIVNLFSSIHGVFSIGIWIPSEWSIGRLVSLMLY